MNGQNREKDLWTRIMEDVSRRGDVGDFGMDSFLSDIKLVEDTGTKLILEYPADMLIDWVEIYYREPLVHSASHVLGGARSIEFVPRAAAAPQAPAPEEKPEQLLPLEFCAAEGEQMEPAADAAPADALVKRRKPCRVDTFNSGLNEDYTFENFVVGPNSEFAYAAAKAVAETPCSIYNPLFIHGASGLGKTHLLQAIGNAIRSKNEKIRVLYVTCEEFTNGYIEAISRPRPSKSGAMNNFRSKYRKADVLIIDDIQFLAKKDKTQDEFFHTFNALFSSKKQIVLSSDCRSSEVIGMDERLTSRFNQGLSVSITAPSYETRMAILRNKIRQWKSTLISDEVLDYLAKRVTRDVRCMEGALVCLSSFASFSCKKLSIADARVQLDDYLNDNEPAAKFSIKTIQQCVADEFKLRVADLNGRRRTANIAHPRQLAMFLARHYTNSSLQDIGAAFGGRDHGTVIHATRTIEQKMQDDPNLRSTVSRLLSALGAA